MGQLGSRRLRFSGALCAVVAALCAAPVAAQPAAASSGRPSSPSEAADVPAATTAPDAAGAADEVDPAVRDEYRRVVAQGVAEFAAGRWAEARSYFLRGHELWPSARTLRSLGMTSFELRAYARALLELQAALDETRRPLSAAQRAQVGALIEQARGFVGRYHVRAKPEHATLLVDGAPHALLGQPLLLEAGRHQLVLRAPGYEPLRQTLDVQGREDQALALALTPLPESATSQARFAPQVGATPARTSPPPGAREAAAGGLLWTWVAGGAALALGATSTLLWLDARAEFEAADAHCKRVRCTPGSYDESAFSTPETAHHVTAGLALVAGAAAVLLFVLESDEPPIEHGRLALEF